ncbi:hypothetical protein ACLOJK_008350 [Asimina triloba]
MHRWSTVLGCSFFLPSLPVNPLVGVHSKANLLRSTAPPHHPCTVDESNSVFIFVSGTDERHYCSSLPRVWWTAADWRSLIMPQSRSDDCCCRSEMVFLCCQISNMRKAATAD